jgi:hypothetical protein
MAAVQLSCAIDGCDSTWSVASAKHMKKSMDEHRAEAHPGWVKPEPTTAMTAYALQYTSRARQF